MANKVIDGMAVCPFYLSEAKRSITCEGLIAKTATITRFSSEAEKIRHEKLCASSRWISCEHARVLLARWEDTE